MRHVIILLLLFSLVGCRSVRYVPIHTTETITTHDTIIELRLQMSTDTVVVQVDTVNHYAFDRLENRYAVSEAEYDGQKLRHVLTIKEVVDTVLITDIKEVERVVEVPVEIYRDPPIWKKIKSGIDIALTLLFVAVVLFIIRYFSKLF